MLEFDLHFL